jgi:hypothetical protein
LQQLVVIEMEKIDQTCHFGHAPINQLDHQFHYKMARKKTFEKEIKDRMYYNINIPIVFEHLWLSLVLLEAEAQFLSMPQHHIMR